MNRSFVKNASTYENGFLLTISCTDPIAALSEQISRKTREEIETGHVSSATIRNLINAAIGRKAFTAFEKERKAFANDLIS